MARKSHEEEHHTPASVESHAPAAEATRAAAEAAHPPPPVVKLTPPVKGDDRSLPAAPLSLGGPLPKLLHQNERAPKGTVRFKIGCRNYLASADIYVLVADGPDAEAAAVQFYCDASGLTALLRTLGDEAEAPKLVVRRQID